MTRILLTAIFLTLFSQAAWAEAIKLSGEENKGFARACHKLVVYEVIGAKNFVEPQKYSYWPTEVEDIDSFGADVSTIIKLKRLITSGGNNGWGQETQKTIPRYFECISTRVAKGQFPEPDYFLDYWGQGMSTAYVKTEFSRRGNELIQREVEWWGTGMIESSYEEGFWGSRSAPFYDAAESRAPHARSYKWSFD